jgi:multidrug efflux system outer membrane protein
MSHIFPPDLITRPGFFSAKQGVMAALIAACMLGAVSLPAEAQTAENQPPAQRSNTSDSAKAMPADAGQDFPAAWWRDFGDARLDTLMTKALTANQDLKIAAARIQQAQALLNGADADFKPQLSAGAEAKRFRETGSVPMSRRGALGLRASWEPDFFGRGKLLQMAAQADTHSQQAALTAMQIALTADVASAYFDLKLLVQRQALLTQAIQLAQRQQEVAQRKFEAGAATSLDADRWQAELAQDRASAAQMQSQYQLRLHQLAILLGQRELPVFGHPSPSTAQLQEPVAPAAKLDVSLIERRPDVQRQASQLDAALARAGLARRDLYPNLSISWAGNKDSLKTGSDSAVTGFSIGYGLTLSLPILDGGRIRSNIAVQDARVLEAQAEYDKALLTALNDVDSCWQQWEESNAVYRQWINASQASEVAASKAERLYQAGASDVSAVLDARRADLKARDALAQADAARWQSAIALRRAAAGAV